MSERNYWDEESFQKYKADLIWKRKVLNPITDSAFINFIDKQLEKMPDHYLESQGDFQKSKQVHKDNYQKEQKTTFKDESSSPSISRQVALVISLLLCVTLYLLLLSTAFTTKRDTYICYTTRTGECYHAEHCWHLKSAYETTVYEASQKGYRPCSHCNPCYKNNKTTIVVRNHTYPILISVPISVTVFLLLGYRKKE